jgi:hypothetical protein
MAYFPEQKDQQPFCLRSPGFTGLLFLNVAGPTKPGILPYAHFSSLTLKKKIKSAKDNFLIPNCRIGYSFKSRLTLPIGARNLFNVYPTRVKNSPNVQEGIRYYDITAPQIGFDGGYYFVNMAFNW